MTETKTLIEKYKGLFYEIEVKKDGSSSYVVYEYTPILRQRTDVLFGASCKTRYTSRYVRKIIDEVLLERNPE